MPNYKSHARHAVEAKFRDSVTSITDFSQTNNLYTVEFNNISPKKIKYHTFKWHPKERFLGGVHAQNYLSRSDYVPDVCAIYSSDPFDEVNTSWYISDYIDGETMDRAFNAEDYRENISIEIASALATTLASIHNVTMQKKLNIPEGQMLWNHSTEEFAEHDETWREHIMSIAQSRYKSYSRNSKVSHSIVSSLYDFIQSHSNILPKVCENPVISNLDFRPGNLAFHNLRSQSATTSSAGIFDWDRAIYGDWQLGLAIGEFFLTNTCQNKNTSGKLQREYRDTYFSEINTSVDIDTDRYQLYMAIQYLQQCRSFNFWYKDKNKNWVRFQKQLTERNIANLIQTEN